MELNPLQIRQINHNFPKVDLPYETTGNSIISSDYNIALAIPYGKKAFLWFTFEKENDVCYIIDINKNKQLTPSAMVHTDPNNLLSLGTILYGTRILDQTTQQPIFIIEDIVMFKGLIMNKITFYNKVLYIKQVIEYMASRNIDCVLCFPLMWEINNKPPDNIAYQVHHIQYRPLNIIKPYLNVENARKPTNIVNNNTNILIHHKNNHYIDYTKPQYKLPTWFQCYADIQNDIYHLYAIGKNNLPTYYNIAGIPDYNTSVFMNNIFRNIRENNNIDYIEESEDEDDFQNTNIDKYVDTNRMVIIECVFNYKFHKWVPMKEAQSNNKIIHINRLIKLK